MKLHSFFGIVLVACGSSTNPSDGGSSGSGSDSSSGTDSSMNGDSGTSSDAPADTAKGEGGLVQGQECDLKNDLCGPGLKCCSEPTHMQPPTHDICVPPQQNGTCPLYP